MADQNVSTDTPIDAGDASLDTAPVVPPEQAPMDPDAGGPTADKDEDDTDDLSVQGGE